jgi:hypothetical protein
VKPEVSVSGSVVAGRHTPLVSGQRCGAGSTASLLASLALHFSIPYDSLIEKCSTLPGLSVSEPWQCTFSSKLSVPMEWGNGVHYNRTG